MSCWGWDDADEEERRTREVAARTSSESGVNYKNFFSGTLCIYFHPPRCFFLIDE
jgi:hypothetical protein